MGLIISSLKAWFFSTGATKKDNEPIKENKTKLTYEDVCFLKKDGQVLTKLPGSLGSGYGPGVTFAIEDCKNCKIFILDWMDQVTVDNVDNCILVIGPVTGSVFLRDCTNSTIVTLSQQFRLRGCENCTILYKVNTQPVIESCQNVKFGNNFLRYDELDNQLLQSKLKTDQNSWDNVYNFTGSPTPGDNSFELLKQDVFENQSLHFKSLIEELKAIDSSISWNSA